MTEIKCKICNDDGVVRQVGTHRIKRVCRCPIGRAALRGIHDDLLEVAIPPDTPPPVAVTQRVSEDQFIDIGSIALRRDSAGRLVATVYLVDPDMRLAEDAAERLSVAARFAVGEAIAKLKGF